MAPLPDGGARRRARLKNERLKTALQEVGGGGEADRARADDSNGKIGGDSHFVLCPDRLMMIDMPSIALYIDACQYECIMEP